MRALKHPSDKTPAAGFTLVEITLAIGIVAFAFVAILGLLPTGMGVFRGAMDSSVGAQIAQKVVNDALQVDFDTLVAEASGSTNFCKAVRYFGDQGEEIASAAGAIYHVNTRVMTATGVPAGGATVADNPNLATLTIQVANNPGNVALAVQPESSPQRKLWTGAAAANPTLTGAVPVITYCAQISKSK